MPRTVDIGRENNEFQRLEVLKRNRTKRKQYGEIFVEGVAAINAIVEAQWAVRAVVYNRESPLSLWAQQIIARANPERVLRLTSDLMAKLSDREDASELIVIAERHERSLASIRLDTNPLVLLFDRPSNHGNLGSIIRSADALGATALITTGHSVDLFEPAVLRASLGAFFALPVIHCDSPQRVESWLTAARRTLPNLKVVGAITDATIPLHACDMRGPVVLLLGNEARGISRALTELVDEPVAIPMGGTVDSLNVACAGTVMLYEASRQRS